jgi:hypothetical protein
VFIAKYSPDGNRLWNLTWASPTFDGARDVAVDASGNIYVCGETNYTITPSLWSDAFVAKYDANQNQLWNATWQSGPYSVGCGIAVDQSGNVYMSGYTNSTTQIIQQIFVTKYDSSGNSLWNTTLGGNLNSWGYGCALDPSGNLCVTGEVTNATTQSGDVFLGKVAPTGNVLWSTSWHGVYYNQGLRLSVNSKGDIYVVGEINYAPSGHYDAIILKFNSTGRFLWNTTWGGPDTDEFNGIACGQNGTIAVAGDSNSWGAGNFYVVVAQYVDVAPTLTHPADVTYSLLTVGNTIEWVPSDPTTQNPTYEVALNGTVVNSSTWSSGVPIVQNVDGLNLGSYNYTITVSDGLGNSASDEVDVTVTPFLLIILIAVVGVAAIVAVIIVIRLRVRPPNKGKVEQGAATGPLDEMG